MAHHKVLHVKKSSDLFDLRNIILDQKAYDRRCTCPPLSCWGIRIDQTIDPVSLGKVPVITQFMFDMKYDKKAAGDADR